MTIALPPRFGLDTDLMGWVGRCVTPPDVNFLFAANQFIQAGKAAGWWDLLSAVYFFCAPTMQAAQQNVKANQFNLPISAGSAGPPSFAPYVGVWSSAGQSFYTAGATIEDICGAGLANSNMIGVYNNPVSNIDYFTSKGLSGSETLYTQMGACDGTYQIAININAPVDSMTGDNQAQFWNNVQTNESSNANLTNNSGYGPGTGLVCNVRTSNSSSVSSGFIWTVITRNVPWTIGLPSSAPPLGSNANLYFLNGGYETTTYCPNPISFGFAGPFNTDAPADMALSLSNACDDFLRALGTYVDPYAQVYTVDHLPPPPNCFDQTTIGDVRAATPTLTRVFQFGLPPMSDDGDPSFAYPATDCIATISDPTLFTSPSTQTQVGIWQYLSPDRALGGPGPVYQVFDQNPNALEETIVNSGNVQCFAQFDDYTKAIGSSLVRIMYSAGYAARGDTDGANVAALLSGFGYTVPSTTALGWLEAAKALGYDTDPWDGITDSDTDILYTDNPVDTTSQASSGGSSVVHSAYAKANADGFFYAPLLGNTGGTVNAPAWCGHVCLNQIVLGPVRLCDLANPLYQSTPQPIRGIYLDWETNDNVNFALAPDGKTDLFTVTCLLLAAAAHGKGLLIAGGFDPLQSYQNDLGLTQANAGIVLADPTAENPGGGLDLVNIVTTNNPAPLPGTAPSDLEAQAMQAYLDIYQNAVPAIPNLASKILVEFALAPEFQEINRLYSASARNFMIENGLSNCVVVNGGNAPGGLLSRPFNQALAAFLGLPIF